MTSAFIDNAKVMAKGQITIPKDIRASFIVDGANGVRMVNSATYAMKLLQNGMSGTAEKAGLNSEEDVMDMISEMRNEGE